MTTETFNIALTCPLGKQKGPLTFNIDGNTCSGELKLFRKVSAFTDGKVNGNVIEVQGEIMLPVGSCTGKMKATIDGDKITGVTDTEYGPFPFEGVRA